MKTLIAVAVMLAFSGAAFGAGLFQSDTVINVDGGSAEAEAKALAVATARQKQQQQQKQKQVQGQIAVNEGNESSNEITIEAEKQAPAIALGGLYPSASCHGVSNLGMSGGGWGFGGGTSWESEDCNYRETSRSFAGLGLNKDAVAVLCVSKYAAEAPTCKALKPAKSAATDDPKYHIVVTPAPVFPK